MRRRWKEVKENKTAPLDLGVEHTHKDPGSDRKDVGDVNAGS